MASISIFDGPLVPWQNNFTDFFTGASYLYCIAPDRPDWSVTGDFVEIDCALLVEVAPTILRQVPIGPGFISTREPLMIPEAIVGSPVQLVMSAGASVVLQIFAVSHCVDLDIDLVGIFDAELLRIRA